MSYKFPRLFYNATSVAGALLALATGGILVFFIALDFITGGASPYLGILTYLVFPAFLVIGLALIPAGMLLKRRAEKKKAHVLETLYPVIDLNVAEQRNAAMIFVAGTFIFFLLSALGSYRAYQYTESVSFCGQLCHSVMEPEFAAYQYSPHARVSCTACHVGPGAGWYARSKLSGLYQVYATLAEVYPRPIPTPIEHLRPAQATCEQCHWPEKFFGAKQKISTHYLSDEANTEWPIELLLKIGGGSPKTGQTFGIHWHMNIAHEIEYYAEDAGRQEISWVRFKDKRTGSTREFASEGSTMPAGKPGREMVRTMDCMDCHNRPTHIFKSAGEAVNEAILMGRLPKSLPGIKRLAAELLARPYSSTAEARAQITRALRDSYTQLPPDRKNEVDKALGSVIDMFERNIFPSMKVRWDAYPDNIGHLNSPGCFRCHGGKLKSADGRVISRDCSLCHIIMSQGPKRPPPEGLPETGLVFEHPVDIGEAWKETPCSDCHTGALP